MMNPPTNPLTNQTPAQSSSSSLSTRPLPAASEVVSTPAPAQSSDLQLTSGKGVRFSVGANQCLDPYSQIREVTTLPAMTRVVGANSWFCGIGSFHGQLIPVTDLSAWCGAPSVATSATAQVLLLDHGRESFGLLVGSVRGVVDLPVNIRPFESSNERLGRLVRGSASSDREVLLIVDLNRLLQQESFIRITDSSRSKHRKRGERV